MDEEQIVHAHSHENGIGKRGASAAEVAEQMEANAEWSLDHEDSPSREVAVKMLESFSGITQQILNITGLRSHRWLYARHESPLTDDYSLKQ